MGPMNLDAEDLRHLATFLDAITDATAKTHVRIFTDSVTVIAGSGNRHIGIEWDHDNERYVLENGIGG